MFNGGGFGNILKQAQAVQANLQKVQEEPDRENRNVSSGAPGLHRHPPPAIILKLLFHDSRHDSRLAHASCTLCAGFL
jgi:hypothetical protein